MLVDDSSAYTCWPFSRRVGADSVEVNSACWLPNASLGATATQCARPFKSAFRRLDIELVLISLSALGAIDCGTIRKYFTSRELSSMQVLDKLVPVVVAVPVLSAHADGNQSR